MADTEKLTSAEVAGRGLDDWRPILGSVLARFETGDFATGLALVNRVGEAAEAANHHPDVDLRYGHVDIALLSHDVHGLTERDVALAGRISEIAADLGVTARPDKPVRIEWALDTWDHEAVKGFWEAVLGVEPDQRSAKQVVDPDGQVPPVWFQQSEEHEAGPQRWHADVWLAPELVAGRIEAAVAAGGTVVDDSEAPSFTVLADPQGNKVCLCTYLDRAGG